MITSIAYDRTSMTLVDGKTLKPLEMGQRITDFRGFACTLCGGTAPHKPGSTGYIYVVDFDQDRTTTTPRTYYTSVFNAAWTTHPQV